VDGALSGLIFSLVGPGRVGVSLARWALACGARIESVGGRTVETGRRDPALPPAGPVADLSTAGEDLLLVAVPDGALAGVAAELAVRPQARVVLHTSGSLPGEVLASLRRTSATRGLPGDSSVGSAVGSFHPLKAFPRPLPDLAEARGVFFAIDADPAARAAAQRLAAAWGGVAADVPPEARTLYHLAASLAAGGVVTLLALAGEIAGRLGLSPEVERGYLELAQGAIAAALEEGPGGGSSTVASLTGPVARGDGATFLRQIEALSGLAPEKVPLVLLLARETLRQQARMGTLGEEHGTLLGELERLIASV
jgi:predicted short-subunit dehydrogenase-like oxidoreductase (DUF2520 family)